MGFQLFHFHSSRQRRLGGLIAISSFLLKWKDSVILRVKKLEETQINKAQSLTECHLSFFHDETRVRVNPMQSRGRVKKLNKPEDRMNSLYRTLSLRRPTNELIISPLSNVFRYSHHLPSAVPISSLDRQANLQKQSCDRTYVRFEGFTAVSMKNGVFWDVTPCGSCQNRYFGGT
jgi:hypothetical protein